ncbi:ABC transporter permease [Xylanimonas oleitrophica]|uniref:ABC transporter permease n=1 Tax=Xylanimonas oleitrophica TaxID=2607479 RepID=A0A2W5X1U2_9MICO|nr:ABC transporter permease subunit [Xylanimonas oleitrophica]PZR54275.1 ABC transporter permease [Xylanimonas oleitrophica]
MTATATARPARVGFGRTLRSEWIKLWSLRSTWWTVGATVVIMVGFALMFAAIARLTMQSPDIQQEMAQDPSVQVEGMFDAVAVVTIGYSFAQLVVAVLGALAVTNEYSSGMVRATFAAVPQRIQVLTAKLAVLVVTTVALSVVGLALSWLVTMPILSSVDISLDLSDGETLRALGGTVLYLVAVVALALGVGTLLRHTAGAIFTLVALLFVLPMVFNILVSTSDIEWVRTINKFLPSTAGERVIATGTTPDHLLTPWVGFAVLAGYAVVALVAAAVVLRRRDA